MKVISWFVFVLMLLPGVVRSQSYRLDSLLHATQSASGKVAVDLFIEIAHHYSSTHYDESLEYSGKAYELARKIRYTRGIVQAKTLQGLAESFHGNNRAAKSALDEAMMLAREYGESGVLGYILTCNGQEMIPRGNLDSAMYFFNLARPFLENNTKEPYYKSFLYICLADYYKAKQDIELQYEYLLRAWKIRLVAPDKSYLPHAGIRMAELLADQARYDEAFRYLDLSRKALGRDTVNNEEISLILQQKALLHARLGQYAEAVNIFYKIRDFYKNAGYSLELTQLLLETSSVFDDLGEYKLSIELALEALKLAEKNQYTYERVRAYMGLAWIYQALGEQESTWKNVRMALHDARKHKYINLESMAANLIGILHSQENRKDSAFHYLNRALTIRQSLNDKKGISNTLSNIGGVYEDFGDVPRALEYEKKSLEIEEQLQRPYGLTYTYVRMGELYIKLNRYTEAMNFLNLAETSARKLRLTSLELNVFRLKRDLHFHLKQYDAAQRYMTLHDNLRDSVFSNELSNQLTIQQSIFQIGQKDEEIRQKNNILALQEANLKAKNNLLWAVSALFLILLLLFGLLYRNNRKFKLLNREIHKQNRELLENQEEITAQNEELAQSNDEIVLQRDQLEQQNLQLEEAQRIIEKQSEEILNHNQKLSEEVNARTQELMDHVQQLEQFTFIASHNLRAPVARIMGLGNLLEIGNLNAEEHHIIQQGLIQNAFELDRVVKDLNIILDVRKNQGRELSMVNWEEEWELVRQNLADEIAIRNAHFETHFHVKTVRSFTPFIHSILINLVGNALKYSKPGVQPVIALRTEIAGDQCVLMVSDNGLGIDIARYGTKLFSLYKRFHDHVEGKGLGLYLVKTQVTSLGGKISVTSKVNEGTTFTVQLPLQSELV